MFLTLDLHLGFVAVKANRDDLALGPYVRV